MKRLVLIITLLIPINLYAQTALSPGIVGNSYNAAVITSGNGTTFALPGNASQITWQVSYSVAPASITIQIQTSLDNTNWFSVATTSSIATDGGTIYSSAGFIRCSITASSGGSGITCGLIAKNAPVAIVSGTSGSVSSNKILVGDGSASAPSIARISSNSTGIYFVNNAMLFSSSNNPTHAFNYQALGELSLPSTGRYVFGNSSAGSTPDVILSRDAANILALRNGTNEQAIRIGPALSYVGIASTTGSLDFLVYPNIVTWRMAITGNFVATVDNVWDIGATAQRPRTLLVGTSVAVGANNVLRAGTPVATGNGTLIAGGTNTSGKVTVTNTGASTVTLTFSSAWTNAPACSVTNETTANLSRATSTTTTVVLSGTTVTGDVFAYSCLGW